MFKLNVSFLPVRDNLQYIYNIGYNPNSHGKHGIHRGLSSYQSRLQYFPSIYSGIVTMVIRLMLRKINLFQ